MPVLALMHVLFAEILDPYDSDDSVEDSDDCINIEGSVMKRLSNSRSALGTIRSTWVLKDHVIAIIHSQVFFIMA